MIIFLSGNLLAHQSESEGAYVRVVSSDPVTKTYTFSCDMDPNTNHLRDFFIREDTGNFNTINENEAEAHDREIGEDFEYTFQEDGFYHVGCIMVNESNFSQLFRGDLHIDLRQSLWNPEIVPLSGEGLTTELSCEYSNGGGGSETKSWEVLNTQTGIVTNLGTGDTIEYTASGHGLYDFICHVDGKSVGLPIELFDSGNPYFPDEYGVPDGVTNTWLRDENEGSQTEIIEYNSIQNIPATCEGGEITSDDYFGGRGISCSSDSSSLSVEAWNKPTSTNPEYFEMYKKSFSGSGIEICLADACISDNGFARQDYPIPLNASSDTNQTENNETEPGNETVETNQTETNLTGLQRVDSDKGLEVKFSCNPEGSSDNLAVDWNFGDGNSVYDIQNNVEHTYNSEGNYYVQCDVWDGINLEFTSLSDYFIITAEQTSDKNGTSFPAPLWLSHSGTEGVSVTHFHLELSENQSVVSTDWEIWTDDNSGGGERVWSNFNATELLRFHTHTPDGNFESSLESQKRLDYSTTYKSRVKFNYNEGNSEWSEWRDFSTMESPIFNESSPDWTAAPGYRVEKFAEDFDVPVHVAKAPDLYTPYHEDERPFLYVTELYGKVKVVYKDGRQSVYAQDLLNFDPFGSITGGGQMGVIGLYVDDQSGNLFVGMVYIDDSSGEQEIKNKIVMFQTTDDGKSYTSSETIIDDLPSAPSHQIEQITKHNGRLYVNLGDAQKPSESQDDGVLLGKIISMNPDGSDVQVYAKGFRNPFGADWSPDGTLYVTDNAPDINDRLVKVQEGENYGWGMSDNFATFNEKRIATLNVSPVDVEFDIQNVFSSESKLYVTVAGPIYQKGSVDGKHILEFTLDSNGDVESEREFVKYTGTGYGTPVGLDFAEGALYFTDIYGEPGFIGLGDTESSIFRVVEGEPNPVNNTGNFRAGISIIPWYPKDSGDGIEYIFECQGIDGSGEYNYQFLFGDGSKTGIIVWDRQYHKYPYGDTDYNVSCTTFDLQTGESNSASMIINPDNFIAEGIN